MPKGRRPSELYQVDFVAALFGGFLLIWLANSAESDSAGDDGGNSPSFLVVTAMVYFNKSNTRFGEWSPALPSKALTLGCAHPGVGDLLRALGANPVSCTASVTQNLNKPSNGEAYYSFVQTQYGNKLPPVALASGLDLDFVVQHNAQRQEASFWGLAFWTLGHADQTTFSFRSDPAFLHEHVLAAVATIPAAEALNQGLSVKINKFDVFDSKLYSIPSQNVRLSGTVDLTNYNFKDVNSVVKPFNGFEDDFHHVVVKAFGVTPLGLSCFEVELERSASGERPMKRVSC